MYRKLQQMNHWEQFNHRNLWQHSSWDAFQQSIGRKTYHLSNAGAQALLIKHTLPFGLSWFEVPRGPLYDNEVSLGHILKEAQEIALRENAVFIRFSSYKKLPSEEFSFQSTSYDKHPENSLILELSLSEEEILAQMKPKGRYNIKVAQKNNISVEPSSDVEAFHNLLKKTGTRDGFGIHPMSYYQKMLEAMGSKAALLVARYEDRIIAGGIFVYLDQWGIYYYGASDHHYRKYMAPYLIQWEAIKEAKKRGCKKYDFLGVAPENSVNHAWSGVSQFKHKFGGAIVNYPKAKDLVLRPFWYLAYKLYKAKK